MAKAQGPYHVHCYHCGRRIEVGARAMSTACPGCGKPVKIEDIVIKSYYAVTNIETCGKLIIKRRGRVSAVKKIVAHKGIELEGKLQCKEAHCAGTVRIGKKAEWKGDLRAMSLVTQPGGKILGGRFTVPDDPLAAYRVDEEKEEEQTPEQKAEA